MANQTVYPYGTGGSLPSSIGIINDLSTGGVDKALSAEQGKIIGEIIGGVEKEITVALQSGGIYAESAYSYFGQLSTSASLTRSDYIECGGYAYLKYRQMKVASSSTNRRFGLVFYDTNKAALAGYPTELASAATTVWKTVEVPTDAVYFRLTYWSNNSSVSAYLTTASNINKKTLVNVLNKKFYAYFSSDTAVDFGLAQLNSGGFYAVANGNNDSRIVLDLRSRDYSKAYRISLKYSNSGVNASKFWCVYTSTIGATENEGIVFSGAGSLPNGDGELSATIPKNSSNINYIRISSQSSSGMPAGAVAHIYDLQIVEEEEGGNTPTGTSYYGPLVNVKQHLVSAGKATSISSLSCQGGACYGNYLFMFTSNNTTCWMYNLNTGSRIQTIDIPSAERGFVSNCHCNTVNFGMDKYDSGDPFPLIYVSTGYAEGGYTGALVYRIVATTENNSTTYSLSLVQTLKMPASVPNAGTWTEFMTGSEGDCYIRYTSGEVVYRMVLPPVSQGDYTFDLSDAIEVFQFLPQPTSWLGSRNQNNMYYNGKIYLVSGVPSSNEKSLFVVMDLATRTREVVVDLQALGLNSEPETCFIWKDHICIAFHSNADVYALYFE